MPCIWGRAAIAAPKCLALYRIPHNSALLAAGHRVRAAFVEFFQTKGHTQVPCHAMSNMLLHDRRFLPHVLWLGG